MSYVPEVAERVAYEGKGSKNPLAFKHYDPAKKVVGKVGAVAERGRSGSNPLAIRPSASSLSVTLAAVSGTCADGEPVRAIVPPG